MRDALSILSSATVLPSSAAPPGQHRHHNRRSSSSATTSRNPTSKCKPQFATYPLASHSRWDNRRSLRYYTYLASKLAEDGRFEDFLMILESTAASGVDASEFLALLNGKSIASGVARLIGEGKLDSIVDLVSSFSRKLGIQPVKLFDADAVESLRRECSRLLNCGQLEHLVGLLEPLAGFQFPIKELVKPSDVIALCIDKRDPTAAIRFAQSCRHTEMLVCSIILEFGKKRDLVSALAAFEASKKLSSPNMHVYRTIIDVCGICGEFLKSRAIYKELLDGNGTPNVYVLNSLMNVNAHDLTYTLDIYRKMEKLGVKADVTSHNVVLKACCLAGKVELAYDIYKEMRRLESNEALKLDLFTYSTIIKVLANVKMWKLALDIKEDMVSSGVVPNTITWSSLISACANAGLVEEATKLFNEMLQAGCQPNSQCFNILLHACVEARQFDRAFRLFYCWKESGFQQTMVDEAVAMDQMKVLLRQFSSLTSRVPFRPTISTYNILMKACGSDYGRAKTLMDEMKTFGLSPNHMTWSILIDICGGSGNLGGALQILKSMREAGIQPDVVTYTTAIKACVEHMNPKLAFILFAEMKKYHIKPNMVTYNTILRARSRYGSLQEVQQCLAVYQHMRKAGYKPNDYYLKQLIEEWCEGVIHNDHQNEVQLASRGKGFGPQSLLLEKVAEHLQQDGKNQSLSIDLRGLTKVEARIVVLAVLRMTKEKYIAGNPIQDDVSITLGLQQQPSPRLTYGNGVREANYRLSQVGIGVKEAVIQLLQHDLGLQVLEMSCSLPQPSESPTRRPVVLQRLKVTKKSLHQWLQRKVGGLTS